MSIYGKIGPARCQCSMDWNAMWFIKENGVVCSNCGRTRKMSVPPEGIIIMPCQCSSGDKATWFITANGNYVCSNCGRTR